MSKVPCVLLTRHSSLEIERVLVVPEIRVFIDVDELESWFYDSSFCRFYPEIERMIVIIKHDHLGYGSYWNHPDKALQSDTGSELVIFDFLKYDIFSDSEIINISGFYTGNREGRGFSIFSISHFPGKEIVPRLCDQICGGVV